MRYFLIFTLSIFSLNASLFDGHTLAIAPEFYWVKRERDGGSCQTGWLGGIRGEYERVVNWGLYWGAHIDWASGILRGKSGSGSKLKSTLTDYEVEARAGYTFHNHWLCCLQATPYASYGYYRATNRFKHPSPMELTFKDSYDYAGGGLRVFIQFSNCFKAGVDFEAKYMLDGKGHVKDRELDQGESLTVGQEWQYDLQVPLYYRTLLCSHEINLGLVPFWRTRHFGGLENYPHDFIETRYQNIGLRFEGVFHF